MKKIIIGILFLTVAGIGAWYFFATKTDEELIRDQLDRLIAACSKRGKESVLVVGMKNSEFSNYIAAICNLSISEMMMNGKYTPMTFAASLTQSRLFFSTMKGSAYDVEIKVNEDKKTATIDYSVRVFGKMKRGDTFDESRDLRSEMVKEEDKWKFASFEIREVLEK